MSAQRRPDPDPIHVEDDFRDDEVRAELGSGVALWIVASAVIAVAAFVVAVLLLAAPRSSPGTSRDHPGPQAALDAALRWAGDEDRSPAGDAPQIAIGEPLTVVSGELPDTATSVAGKASWYCGAGSRCTRGYPAGSLVAAAGPALRIGGWRGRTVRVCSSGRCVRVTLRDWCACGSGRVIDLYRAAFARLAPPSRGVIRVEVSWPGGAASTLPPTETIP